MYVSIEYCQLSDKSGFGCNAKELPFASAIYLLCSYCFSLKLVSIFEFSPVLAADEVQYTCFTATGAQSWSL